MTQVSDSSVISVQLGESKALITKDGTKNYKGEPADKSKTGGIAVLPFIFGAEFAERCAAFGVSTNIISYLFYVKHLHLSNAANLTTNYLGSSYLFTLLGGFLADTYLGRFWTIASFGVIQMLGCGVLIVNAALEQFKCLDPTCPPAHGTDLALIYLGLYLVALGTGGIKSSVSGFGADQFEKEDPSEAKHLPHYFNWFFFMIAGGALVGATIIIYIQDRSWPWGFGSLVIVMFVSLFLLFLARTKYRYKIPQGSPFTAMAKVSAAAFKNRNLARPGGSAAATNYDFQSGFYDVARHGTKLKVAPTSNMRWLDKAAVIPAGVSPAQRGEWSLATVTEVENFKMVLRLLPILATTWLFWTVEAQFLTFTVTQAITTNRHLGPNFEVPPASINAIKTLAVMLSLFLYDKVFLPRARKITGHPSGITTLQRIGAGLVCSIISMVCAALVERRRLHEVHELNWELKPRTPMKSFSMFWLLPQYMTMGLGEALIYPGQIDFFYSESPESMQSLGTSFCLATLAIGAFGSSAIVSAVNSASSPDWLDDNLNTSRLDIFFWVLAALSGINLILFVIVARFHKYKKTIVADSDSSSSDDDAEEGQELEQQSKAGKGYKIPQKD